MEARYGVAREGSEKGMRSASRCFAEGGIQQGQTLSTVGSILHRRDVCMIITCTFFALRHLELARAHRYENI
jgi:hypothetical protein